MQLYQHQLKALALIKEALFGILQMTCGSGKSAIYKEAAREVRTALIMVPRKILVDQLYDDYFKDEPNMDVLKLNSDHRTQAPAKSASSEIDGRARKRRKLTARQMNAEKETNFLQYMKSATVTKPFVVIANYQSVRRLAELMQDQLFDISFFDEGHNVLLKSAPGDRDSETEDEADDEPCESSDEDGDNAEDEDKCITVSSAPQPKKKRIEGDRMETLRQFKGLNGFPSAKYFFCTATTTEMMLQHPNIYGKVLINFSYNDAVKEGIVKKFKLHVECLKTDENEDTPAKKDVPFLWSIGQFIMHQNLRRVIVYTNRIRDTTKHESLRTSMALETFREQERAFHLPRKIRVDYITHHTTLDQRQRIFRTFRNTKDSQFRMIVSCRTISEGVDLTSADGIILLDSRSNNITTTQRILRCTRLTKDERRHGMWDDATVLIPLLHHSISSFNENRDLNEWLDRFVTSLNCQTAAITSSDTSSPSGPNTDDHIQIPIVVGNDIDSIPYDPNECTKDPKRENVKKLLCMKMPNLSEDHVDDVERGIFHFVVDESRHKGFARNWDDSRFSKSYLTRSMLIIASLKRKPSLQEHPDLYHMARYWTREQLEPSLYQGKPDHHSSGAIAI